MFARIFAIASLAAFVVAQECSTGPINCCNNSYDAEDMHSLFSQFGINTFAGLTGLVGTGCSPVSGVGVGNGGASCSQQPLCCNGNTFSGLISIGCSPIGINL